MKAQHLKAQYSKDHCKIAKVEQIIQNRLKKKILRSFLQHNLKNILPEHQLFLLCVLET